MRTLYTCIGALLISLTTTAQSNLDFIENKGQWEDQIMFKTDLDRGRVFLEKNTFTYVLDNVEDLKAHHAAMHSEFKEDFYIRHHAFKMHFEDANPNPGISSSIQREGIYNYFIGDDESKWASEVHRFQNAHYQEIYSGIDMKAYSENNNFKYDFIIHPGANTEDIKLTFEGLDGVRIEEGYLIMNTTVGEIRELRPYSYQIIDGKEIEIPVDYSLNNGVVSFTVNGDYDRSSDLIIDPTLVAATFSGTVGNSNWGHCATYDDAGNIYTGAINFGGGYPTVTGAYQSTFGGGGNDIAISKLSPDGSSLIYANYLGGSGSDYPHSMVVSSSLELYVLGSTDGNYPTTGGSHQPNPGGGVDMVVTHFNAAGTALVGSTYIGGSGDDGRNNLTWNYGDAYRGEIIVDNSGNCYVAANTASNNFPTSVGAYQTTAGGQQDGVVFKLNNDLSILEWSTYIGDNQNDAAFGLRIDNNNDVVVAGAAGSAFLPAQGYQTTLDGAVDAYILRLSSDGTTLMHSTYYGQLNNDYAFFVDLDVSGNVYIYGQSEGGLLPVSNGVYGNAGSNQYIAEFNDTLGTLNFNTVLGSGNASNDFIPIAFMVDNCGYIYFSGHQSSVSLPVSTDALQTSGGFYLGVLEPHGVAMRYSTHYGGSSDHVDGGTSRFDPSGVVYQGVCTNDGFNTTANAYAPNYPSQFTYDIGVFKIDFEVGPGDANIDVDDFTACSEPPYDVDFAANGNPAYIYEWNFGDGNTSTDMNPTNSYQDTGLYNITLVMSDTLGCVTPDTATATVEIILPEPFEASWNIIPPAPCSDTMFVELNFNGSGTDSLIWDMGDGTSYTNEDSVNYTYYIPGTYTIAMTAYDYDCNLENTLSETFTLNENPNYGPISMPNIFSPDGDDKNPIFKPVFLQNPQVEIFDYLIEYDIEIYNRWGKLVFESGSDYSTWGWDGTTPKGKAIDEGVYFYLVSYTAECEDTTGKPETEKIPGFIHVVRSN